jgi:lysophospholipase L1-like esterase
MPSIRIAFIGDSMVNGTGDDDALGWVGRVVARARQRGCDVTAYNLGIRRDTSADVAARWQQEARCRLPPEHDGRLVFSFARAILGAARAWLPTLMVGPPVIADSERACERILALSADYAELCGELGVPYLALARVTQASEAWMAEAIAGDGAHPNRGGYAVVAAVVAEWPAWKAWVETAA